MPNYPTTGLTRVLHIALIVLLSTTLSAELSEPDHVLYGQLSWFGEPITAGEVAIAIDAWPEPVARYELGSDPALGPQYALRIPMDAIGQRIPGTAREGDDAVILFNGEAVAMTVVGERGSARRLDLDPESLGQPTAGLLINSIAVSEGAAGTQTPATFTVTLTQAVEDPVSFNWVTENGTATGGTACASGIDYIQGSGAGEILPGQQQTQLTVMICGNDEPDGDRHFFVELREPHNATLLNPLGQATILDTDTPPEISINNITVQEPSTGERTAAFKISLSEPWEQPVSVNWATANGSAQGGIDYIADSGQLTIPAGAQSGQIQVTVLANPLNQDDRDFFVELSNPVNGTLLREQGQALIVSATQTLAYVETHQDGVSVTGMTDPAAIAVASPDGGHVYVASRTADELVVFERDSGSGALMPRQLVNTGAMLAAAGRQIDGIDGFAGLAVSPDGTAVYAVSPVNDAVVAFSRNDDDGDAANYGRLSLVAAVFQGDVEPTNPAGATDGLQGARGVTVSPDGLNVYVAGATEGTIAVFRRNPTSGALTYSEVERNGVNNPNDPGPEVQGTAGAFDIAVTPDGQFVYVTGQSSDAVAVFSRDASSGLGQGRLTFIRHYVDGIGGVSGIMGAAGLASSPDGSHLYVVGQESDSLAVFRRESNGDLTWLQAAAAGGAGMQGLEEPRAIAVSPEGDLIYVTGLQDGNAPDPGTLTILRRDHQSTSPDFGKLVFEEIKRNQVGGIHGLWGATAVAVSPDDAHIYVAARWDRAVTVFARDQVAPLNPEIESSSHEIEQWHNEAVIAMRWSGAVDPDGNGAAGGSGVQGYSVLFSQSPDSSPDESIDVAHTEDPHGIDSEALPDGDDHWFHLRTCDFAGNCSEPASVGPYWIDTVAPTNVQQLASHTHEAGAPSIPEAVIGMQWEPATDPGDFASGVAGYSYVFNSDPQVGPNEVINLGPEVTATDSNPLPSGMYYFHIASVDVAGNWSEPLTAGPFGVGTDDQPPQVQEVSSVAAPDTGAISAGAGLEGAVTQLLIRFSEPMAFSGPGDAGNVSAYRLFADNGGTPPDCAGAPAQGLIAEVDYEPFTHTTQVRIDHNRGLPAGDYVLIVCDQVEDLNGNPLDGDGSGEAGGDFALHFGITRDNRLVNPNFDTGLGVWSNSSGSIGHDADVDADGWPVSGAARFEIAAGDASAHALSQCVSVSDDAGLAHALRARVRMEEVDGGDPSPVHTFASVVFYSQANCGVGSELAGAVVSNTVSGDSAGQWLPLSLQTPPGASVNAVSALVSMNLEFPSSAAFPVRAWFDRTLFFAVDDDVPPAQSPRIETVGTTRAYEWEELDVGLPTEHSITQLRPVFTHGVFSAPGGQDAEAVNNPANYRVLQAGPAGEVETTGCGPVLGGDIDHAVNAVNYDSVERRAVVMLGSAHALPAGRYRFIVCGNIRDFEGNYLDGSGQDQPGSDYLLDFEVATTNLVANPNLDSTTIGWTLEAAPGGTLERGSADVDAHLSSGSLRVQHDTGTGAIYRAGQCVDLQGLHTDLTLEAAVLVNQSAGNAPQFAGRVWFHDAPGCGGDEVAEFDMIELVDHTAGDWLELISRLPDAPEQAQSAWVSFEVETDIDIDAPFSLWMDHLMLRSGNADLIFRNRFAPGP